MNRFGRAVMAAAWVFLAAALAGLGVGALFAWLVDDQAMLLANPLFFGAMFGVSEFLGVYFPEARFSQWWRHRPGRLTT